MIIRRIAALGVILALLAAPGLRAQDEASPDELLERWDQEATRAEEVLGTGEAATSALEVMRESLVDQRAAARTMVEAEEKRLQPLTQQLEALGPPPEGEDVQEAREVAVARDDLNQRIETASAQKKKAELALARAETLIQELDSIIRARFTSTLLSIGPSPLSPWRWINAAAEYRNIGVRLVNEAAGSFSDPVSVKTRQSRLPALVIAMAVAAMLVIWARRRLGLVLRRRIDSGASRGRRLAVGLAIATMRLFSPLIVLGLFLLALRQSGLLGTTAYLLQAHFVNGLVAIIIAYGLGLVLFSPSSPELRLVALSDNKARRGSRLFGGLGITLFLEMLLVRGGADVGVPTPALAVVNLPVVLFGSVLLFRLARLIRPTADLQEAAAGEEVGGETASLGPGALRLFSTFMMLAAALAPVLAAVGYFAASRYVLFPTIMTTGLFAGALIVFIAIREGIDAYVEDREVEAPGLRLLSILLGFFIACAAIPALALIWGARVADLSEWWLIFAEGLSFGEVTISPIDFLTFALVFTIGYSLTRLVKGLLRSSVLPNTRLDSGARAAIISGAGYVGVIIAALAAIAATGLDLSNIAIVAGALSVGIGFGLQNIVNNFVSGIILLIERPIKAGDWIEVGGQQGYVSNVSVRATEIETFDRATLIVPNSELISSTVLNMTHSNLTGRVRVPVGVAYGTDVRKVERILLEIARAHPLLLTVPAPAVLFMGFGDDALKFEIRGILSDVNYILNASSDINFEIDRRFREEGIEIPFAQRDVHLKNPEAIASSISAALKDGTRTPSADVDGGEEESPAPDRPRRPMRPSDPPSDDG